MVAQYGETKYFTAKDSFIDNYLLQYFCEDKKSKKSMSKKIVLISICFRTPKNTQETAVCNYFAKEWVQMGHQVLCAFLNINYPDIFYLPALLFRDFLASKIETVVRTKAEKQEFSFSDSGVVIHRLPIFKYIPRRKCTKSSINEAYNRIVELINDELGGVDYLIGHFPNPQIEIIERLKYLYPSAKTAIIMHGGIQYIKSIYGYNRVEDVKNIDIWGFRSESIKNSFCKVYGCPRKSFYCYSGIPGYFLDNLKTRDYKSVNSFLYVGVLISRKYPDVLIDALDIVFNNNEYTLKYIGDGNSASIISKKANGRNNIQLLGKLSRKEVINHYDDSDCMILISEREAFGLVYLEAMARGCIVIASRNEGIDGVIIDGENGFLCEAGNTNELKTVISKIIALTPKERSIISKNAMFTASKLTDKLAAEMYLQNIECL